MSKKIKLDIETLVDLEILARRTKAKTPYWKSKLTNPDDIKSISTYRNMNGYDKKIHQGFKIIQESENE
tara:strand:+ start:130 stop:336 length:207 start_codon:yes stop_codon:yes gene_type:complete